MCVACPLSACPTYVSGPAEMRVPTAPIPQRHAVSRAVQPDPGSLSLPSRGSPIPPACPRSTCPGVWGHTLQEIKTGSESTEMFVLVQIYLYPSFEG